MFGVACLLISRNVLADGGCSDCFHPSGCVWVCALIFGPLAIPVWLVLAVVTSISVPRLRRSLSSHLVALPLAYVGAARALGSDSAPIPQLALTTAVPPLAWYLAVITIGWLARLFARRPPMV